eukprot:TRINITY_DN4907_c0_g1_i1.p1 TRINITY_DN4907_c0_g1~~TRINITY_DN4907_c0_g1_i1.p1  ORF type:complete len:340 (+),score=70.90 TRINITY_DN4907_c0_g1_i1:94-1020(+)
MAAAPAASATAFVSASDSQSGFSSVGGFASSSSGTAGVRFFVSRSSRSRISLSVSNSFSSRVDRSLPVKFKGFHISRRPSFWKLSASEVVVQGSTNNAAAHSQGLEVPHSGENGEDSQTAQSSSPLTPTMSDSSISALMSEVTNLIKLVDSRDITELQVKQQDCEILIRKKEALAAPPAASPQPLPQPGFMASPSPPPAAMAPPPTSAIVPAGGSVPSQASTAAKPVQSERPCIKSPMAGTFYRSPGPGEPPFIKVGDKVQKGQVVCIVEAMKLMNEIEADQSGTIVEILAEDGKPVSVDMPLFVIKP